MSVKNIYVKDTELNTIRIRQIKGYVNRISASQNVFPQRVSGGNNKIIFCVNDSTRITNISQFENSSAVNERFKTINPLFRASYYEIWDKVNGTKQNYVLNRIYFHLYLSENDQEYILLHTDPIDNDKTHGDYKRSPHLHIKCTNDNTISHAHFALNINDYEKALSSLDEINKCFKNHIDMLSHQILKIK